MSHTTTRRDFSEAAAMALRRVLPLMLVLVIIPIRSAAQFDFEAPFEFITNNTLLRRSSSNLDFAPPPANNRYAEYGKAFTLVKASGPGSEASSFKVQTKELDDSWNVIKKIGGHFYSVKKGKDVIKDGVCAILPVQLETQYKTLTITTRATTAINGFVFSSVPFIKQSLDTAYGAMFDLKLGNFGLCVAFNRDALLFSIAPGFPKVGLEGPKGMDFVKGAGKPIDVSLAGFGISWRDRGTLAYSSKAFNPWTGYNSLNPAPPVPVAANVWMSMELGAAVFPQCPLCKLTTRLSVFTGASRSDKKYAAGVVVENFRVNLAIFPLIDFGSGFGVWRMDESTPKGADSVCNPSGLFIQVKHSVTIPLLDSVIKKFVDFNINLGTVDVFATFRPTDGIYGVGFRFTREISILGINLGSSNMEVQYVSQQEVGRRRVYFGPTNPCKIRCSKYVDGICADARHVDRFILQNSVSSDYVLLAVEYKKQINFLGSFLFSVKDVRFYFAEFMKKAVAFVVAEVKKFANGVKKAWNEVKDKVTYIAREIEKLFTTGPLKFLGSEFKAFAKDIKELCYKIKEFAEKFGDFAKDEAQAYIDAGKALSRGDMKEFGKSIGRVFTDNFISKGLQKGFNEAFGKVSSTKYVDAPGVQKNGCKNKFLKTTTCQRIFGINTKCKSKVGTDPFPDPDCMKNIAKAAYNVQKMAEDAVRYKEKLAKSEKKLPAIKAIIDKNVDFKLEKARMDPFTLNLNTANSLAGSTVKKPYNPQVKVTTEVLSNTPGKVLNPPTTKSMGLGDIRLTGVSESEFHKQLEGKQKGFNEALKNFVMNGQGKLDL
ncbi:hypothetical protein HDU96_008080 [Phlyctochytrium bullatum]|nr:hypothetical protein HDU96_008080 [Phlyctochytrium bullatum]